MNYRHAFHAGNFADVLKHVVLVSLVQHLEKKSTPFAYVDTHAGRGVYDLSEPEAQRSGEYKTGIGRLLEVPAAELPGEIRSYVELVRQSAGPERSPITAYPGSPKIVAMLRREGDRMALYESVPQEADALRAALGRERGIAIIEGDGYAGLRAQLPPKEKRGLVLIDPPYESEREFDSVLDALQSAHARWPSGIYCIWYPRTGRAGPERFLRELERMGIRRILNITLDILPRDSGAGMPGAGLVIVNPPWQLDEKLRPLLTALRQLLSVQASGSASVGWLVGE